MIEKVIGIERLLCVCVSRNGWLMSSLSVSSAFSTRHVTNSFSIVPQFMKMLGDQSALLSAYLLIECSHSHLNASHYLYRSLWRTHLSRFLSREL